MMTRTLASLFSLGLLTAGAAGCGEATEAPAADGLQIVVPGKDDNYYSNVAREFELQGALSVELSEEARADEALRDELIQKRLTAVGLYLTAYLTDKFEGIDIDNSGTIEDSEIFFRNVDYGGFKAMVRNFSIETEDVAQVEDGNIEVTFTIDVAGPADFVEQILARDGRRDGEAVLFDLRMPKGATSDPEAVARGEIRNFDANTYSGETEAVELLVTELPEIQDAYPHYADFMADGVLDVTLFHGHDYNTPRADLQESQETFEHLVRKGFSPPVATYEELTASSGPFIGTMYFRGEEVRVEVRIFHGDMFLSDREGHRQTAIDELIERDIFFYNGHAGPYFGLYLDGDHAADVDYRALAEIAMQPDRQQLFIAQGCQTYSQYADMLYANPAKSEANLDAITTVNYSYGIGTLPLLDNLIGTDAQKNHVARSFYDLVAELNREYWNAQKEVFYGVMGLDGSPQLHPQAEVERIGQSCGAHADCGTTTDAALCLGFSDGGSYCVARTLGESGCPESTTYAYVADGTNVLGGVCY